MTKENYSVLAVDDDPLMLELLKAILKPAGYVVEIAANAAEALKKVAERKFDLIVTDYQMPGMTGNKLAWVIKAQSFSQKIIILSGAVGELLSSGVEVKADLIVSKPFHISELMTAVERLLCGRKKTVSNSGSQDLEERLFRTDGKGEWVLEGAAASRFGSSKMARHRALKMVDGESPKWKAGKWSRDANYMN